jgi:hypothetical protein
LNSAPDKSTAPSPPLIKADSISITIKAEKATGALRVTYGAGDDAKVIGRRIVLKADTA